MDFKDWATPKRSEGSDNDIRYVVLRLREGMPWEKAKLGCFPPLDDGWLEENKKYIIDQVHTDRWRRRA